MAAETPGCHAVSDRVNAREVTMTDGQLTIGRMIVCGDRTVFVYDGQGNALGTVADVPAGKALISASIDRDRESLPGGAELCDGWGAPSRAHRGVKASTIRREVAAIRYTHKRDAAGFTGRVLQREEAIGRSSGDRK